MDSNYLVTKIFELSKLIHSMYMKLAKLEIDGKKNSQEYKEAIPILRRLSKRFDNILFDRKLWNRELVNVADLITTLCEFEDSYLFNYVDEIIDDEKLHIKRILQRIYEIESELQVSISEPKFEEYIETDEDNEDYAYINIADQSDSNEKNNVICDEYLMDLYEELDYNKTTLDIHTFMDYLLDEIEITKNKDVKNELIYNKYKMISLFRNLELSFLRNQDKFTSVEYYHRKLDSIFKKEPKLYSDYVLSFRYVAHQNMTNFIDRDKTHYDGIEDRVYDILSALKLKTLASIVYNDDVRDEILQDAIVAEELATTEINKKVLRKVSNISEKHILKNKNN